MHKFFIYSQLDWLNISIFPIGQVLHEVIKSINRFSTTVCEFIYCKIIYFLLICHSYNQIVNVWKGF